MRRAVAILLAITIAGCATMGREVTKDQMAGFQRGKATIAEVTADLGPPTMSTTLQDGRQVIDYTFAHAQARPESFIPFIGPLVGGADVRTTSVRFFFDKDGVLQDFVHSASKTGAGYGLSGGAYHQPDRSLPKEASPAQ